MRRDPSILCQQEPLAVLYVPDYFDLALGSVVAFGDPARRMRPSSVSWSPVDQMTLVVASSADDYPVVQVPAPL